MELPGIVLAGGKSKRMGKNKATLLWNNKTWIECVIHALVESGCSPIIVSVNSQDDIIYLQEYVNHYNVIWVIDEGKIAGMKGGLISSLRYASKKGWDIVQLAPCDTPQITAEVFNMFSEIWSEKYDILVPNIKTDKNFDGFEPLLARVRVREYLSKLINFEYENDRIISPYSKLNVYLVTDCDFEKFKIDKACISNYNLPQEIT